MTRLTRIAAAIATVMVVPVYAASTPPVANGTIYGGGATLPVSAYVGGAYLKSNPAKRLSVTSTSAKVLEADPADPKSLFGNFTVNGVGGDKTKLYKVSYCGTGSGLGRNVIRGTADATGTCGDYNGNPTGFSALTAAADFAGTDAPFSATEYNSFATGPRAARVAPVQFPAVAASIAIVYNNADLGNTTLNLTESQICQIFAGQITNWNQINPVLPSKTIKLVPRSDSSGTTFSMTNHLSAVCPTAVPNAVTGFQTQNTFTGISGLPAGSVPASGNGGVVTTVLATDGAIGYADIADGKIRAALAGGQLLRHATVSIKPDVAAYTETVIQRNADGTPKIKNGAVVTKLVKYKAQVFKKHDPLKNLPKSVALTSVGNKALGANDANGRPTLVDLTPISGSTSGCMQLVDPSSYAKPAINAKKGDYVQYPIIAVSYLTGYEAGYAAGGDTAKADAVRALFKLPYGISSKVKTIGSKTGFAGLTLTLTNAPTGVTTGSALVDACVKN
ncbi:substrate-binding domain-containing protein [Agitococcus lubricus]|uniref:Periplasmic binding family protein n=1 Tax=Agitococcus lubricus TaxID=1077255 RepID=A0A2T5IU30_9GAMM|nr:substrate-binding domain-containing protein [Agitococcus lubricus]PTQ87374.1 periplasmic binding family protein [Agitococcus lubricus]